LQEPIVLLADIHGNLEALNAVLEEISELQEPRIVCLGDIVGYGPDPGQCLSELRKRNATIVAGNHDAAVAGELSPDLFNKMARTSSHWTRKQLSEEQLQFLQNLPRRVKIEDLLGVHGTPADPLMEYLINSFQAQQACQNINASLLAVAHTHEPAHYREYEHNQFEKKPVSGDTSISWNSGNNRKLVLNPGSVGQPRDGDPRASFTVWEPGSGRIRWKRVEYPIDRVQQKIYSTQLPPALGQRLTHGH